MAFTLWNLLTALLLFINGLAVLHEQRFLAKIGWAYTPDMDPNSVKAKIVNLLHAVRILMQIPLIFINIGVVVLLTFLG